MVLAAGKRLGPYQILSRIGSGGMGEVYRARDAKLRRDVAVKVLPTPVAKNREYQARFEREALAVAALSHPNILSIFDFGVQGGIPYAVMELLEGETLRDRLAAGPIPQGQALSYALQIAKGITAAHEKGVVHRDLKPDNLFILPDGHVKILDFGLAKRSESDARCGRRRTSRSPAPSWERRATWRPSRCAAIRSTTARTSSRSGRSSTSCCRAARRSRRTRPRTRWPRSCTSSRPSSPRRGETLRRRSTGSSAVVSRRRRSSVSRPPGRSSPPSSRRPSRRPRASCSPRRRGPADGASSVIAIRPTPTPSSRRGAPEAERRQVTVLVCGCEVFESEAYLERLDAEDQARVLRGFQQACDRAARRFEGTVVQCDEHGLLLCFGYPVAFEDGARRAAHTAVAILAEMESLAGQLRGTDGLELGPWVGVHTGPAVVGGGPGPMSLVGEARNVAVRLKDAAVVGGIVCSGATHRLIRSRFDCARAGEQRIKGLAQPIEIYQVQGVAEVRNPLEAPGAAGLTPLTGRDLEITLLKDRWERAQEGAGQIVLLIGEPGLGKSRLVQTMKQFVREQEGAAPSSDAPMSMAASAVADPAVVEWRCSGRLQNTGLYPATEFFERFLGLGLEEAPALRFERLVRHLGDYDLARPELVPLFAIALVASRG